MGSFSRYPAPPESDSMVPSQPKDWGPGPDPTRPSDLDTMLRLATGLPVEENVRSVLLAKAVEYEIIPRLMLAHRVPQECDSHPVTARSRVTTEDVAVFAEIVLHDEDDVVRDCVITLRDRGVPVEAIFLDLLAPVARLLGEMWERDLCTFSEVTLGLGRLQKVLRENSAAFGHWDTPKGGDGARRILLLPCPGEQHTFGLSLVAEFFHRAGWDVVTCFLATEAATSLVSREWYDVVGFSLGRAEGLATLAATMGHVRELSRNPSISIIAGGPVFLTHPELAQQIPADAILTDGPAAPEVAGRLVASKSAPS
jgi:methanogenic corrinoid protein MtbC1